MRSNATHIVRCTSVLGVLLELLVLGLLFGSRLHGQEDVRPDAQGLSFPGAFGIDVRWEGLGGDALDATTVQGLLQEDVDGKNVVACGDSRYASLWAAVDRRLAQQPQPVAALRALEDAEAPSQLAAARRAGDTARLLAVCRRYPWAEAVHAALLDYGDQLLREGHAGLALRCFDDVLRRSGNPAVCRRAQAGAWLAAAHLARSPDESKTVTDRATKEPYPWLEGPADADAIAGRLKAGVPPAVAAPTLKSLDVRSFALPSEPAWLYQGAIRTRGRLVEGIDNPLLVPSQVQPVVAANGVLVAGPNLLAWFAGENLRRPQWKLAIDCGVSLRLWSAVAPGPFQPAVADRRIYTRWGIEQSEPTEDNRGEGNPWANRLKDVVALDCSSGTMLWSSANQAAWQELYPINDPAYADGQVYVLALAHNREYSPLRLVCFDGTTGSIVWQRELVNGHTVLMLPPPQNGARRGSRRVIDVARFGNAVTVAGGAVYWSTNLGVVGRCDARDGLIEWITAYEQNPARAGLDTLLRRQGAPPLVTAGHVLFTPRDTTAVLALDRDTGAPRWQKTGTFTAAASGTASPVAGRDAGDRGDVPVEILAAVGDCVLVTAGRQLAGVDIPSGKARWVQTLDEPVEPPAWIVGDCCYLHTRAKLLEVDPSTGTMVASRPWQPPVPCGGVALEGTSLLALKPGDRGLALEDPSSPLRDRSVLYWSPVNYHEVHIFRPVFPTARPPRLEGDPTAWQPEHTVIWTDRQGREGQAWVAHDGANLYLGISHPEESARPRKGRSLSSSGNWLELRVGTMNRELTHSAVGMDDRGQATWENLAAGPVPLPAGVRAVIAHQAADCRLTYEVAIPLTSLTGKTPVELQDYTGNNGWCCFNVTMIPHADGGHAGVREDSSPIAEVTVRVQVQPRPLGENELLQTVARQLPDLDASWQYQYEAWQSHAPDSAKPSEFYRQYIEQHPDAPGLKTARARLEQLLSNDTPQGVQALPPAEGVPSVTKQMLANAASTFSRVCYCRYNSQLWKWADLLMASDPDRRAALRKMLLKQAHATDVPKWLDKFHRATIDERDCVPAIEQLIAECDLNEQVLADFRRRAAHSFVRTWQVIGPFATPEGARHVVACPVEQEPVTLQQQYEGLNGTVAWRLLSSDHAKVNLASLFDRDRPSVGYAVCWIDALQPKSVRIELGSDEGIQLWVNRKLIFDAEVHRQAEPGQDVARADLVSGWNEVLLKVDHSAGPCGFYLELRDTTTGRPCEGLKVRTDNPVWSRD